MGSGAAAAAGFEGDLGSTGGPPGGRRLPIHNHPATASTATISNSFNMAGS